jgi:hypothetical protein
LKLIHNGGSNIHDIHGVQRPHLPHNPEIPGKGHTAFASSLNEKWAQEEYWGYARPEQKKMNAQTTQIKQL